MNKFFLIILIILLTLLLVWIFYLTRTKEKLKIIFTKDYNSVKIPHIIHQTWKDSDLPNNYKTWSDECKKLHPDWKYILWTDDDNRNFIKNYYPSFLPLYDSYDKKIKKIDAVRYFYLYHYGGVYMDLDFACLKNLDPLVDTDKAVFGFQLRNTSDSGSIANAFMAAPPKHPLFRKLINNLYMTRKKHVLQATGPSFLTGIIRKYKGNDVIIYKMPIIYTHEWNEKNTCKNVKECKNRYPDAYTTTFWTGSWIGK